jgi:hypothetical protein
LEGRSNKVKNKGMGKQSRNIEIRAMLTQKTRNTFGQNM